MCVLHLACFWSSYCTPSPKLGSVWWACSLPCVVGSWRDEGFFPNTVLLATPVFTANAPNDSSLVCLLCSCLSNTMVEKPACPECVRAVGAWNDWAKKPLMGIVRRPGCAFVPQPPKTCQGSAHSAMCHFQVLLGFPQSLQPRGRAFVPHLGIFLPEGPAVTFEELWQHRVLATVGSLLLQLPGESQVRLSVSLPLHLNNCWQLHWIEGSHHIALSHLVIIWTLHLVTPK